MIRDEAPPLVRRGGVGDADRLTAVFWAARGRMAYLPALYTYEQTAWWVEHVMAPQSELWVAERHGAAVGFAALQGDRLDHLYVEPAAQGQGVGEALLAEAKRRRSELHLRVFEQNAGARAFYERHGFAVVDVGDGSDNEERLPDLHLRWHR
nr:GNAT family N-acetyltransferase [Glycomyces sp. TRM65418]